MSGSDTQAAFYYQNIVAAMRLVDLIEFGSTVSKVVLENPDLGKHIDDVIVYDGNITRYIQVKWSKDEETSYTLHNLTTAAKDETGKTKQPLIAQLAKGFTSLEAAGTSGQSEVVLFSIRTAGTNKQPKAGFDVSLDVFIREFLEPFVSDNTVTDYRLAARYETFKDVLEKLSQAASLTDPLRFSGFLKHLRFQLGQPEREQLKAELITRLERLGIGRAKYDSLLNAVVEWSINRSELRASDVLRRLGLHDHFVDRLIQDFPADAELCVPPEGVFEQLDHAISSVDSGFVLLEGAPGTGKSTAITLYRARRKDVALGYYCYIPDERTIGNARLERESFIRAFCIGLRNAYASVEFAEPFAEYTVEKLNLWLRKISQRGRKAVFFVDGLDHADRATGRSLLQSSLVPVLDGRLPANVIIVLTAQYIEALPPEARSEIESDTRRRIRITPFGYTEIDSFFRRRGIPLAEAILQRALKLSDGVPLYLEYLAEQLRYKTKYQQEQYLNELPALAGGQIDQYHQHLWEVLEPEAVPLFAVLAVRREFTSIETLLELLPTIGGSRDRTALESIITKHRHLLQLSDARSLSIRHNSFREFVLARAADHADRASDAILGWYASHPENDDWWRNHFRHLYEAGKYQDLIARCTEDWVHSAWTAFRPIEEVSDNLNLAWRAAVQAGSFEDFLRLALLVQRVGLVATNLEGTSFDFASMLLDIGRPREALRAVWDGARVRCAPIQFARFAIRHQERLKRPLPDHVLGRGLGTSPPRGDSDELMTYFVARAVIDSWEIIFREIDGLSWRRPTPHGLEITVLTPAEVEATRMVLKGAVLDQLHQLGHYEDLEAVAGTNAVEPTVAAIARALCVELLAQSGEIDEAKAMLPSVPVVLPPARLRRLVLALVRHEIDPKLVPLESLGYVAPNDLPDRLEVKDGDRPDPRWLDLYSRLRVRFLLDHRAKSSFWAAANGLMGFTRDLLQGIGELASLWCDRANSVTASKTALAKLRVLIAKLYPGRSDDDDYALWAAYRRFAPQLFDEVWDCASWVLEPADLHALAEEWLGSSAPSGFALDVASGLAIRLYEQDHLLFSDLIESALTLLEARISEHEETSVLVAAALACCATLGRCGRVDHAMQIWKTLFDLACGISWRKDYQLNEIFAALPLAHAKSPERTCPRLAKLLWMAHQIEGAAQSKTVAIAIEELAEFASNLIDPSLGLELLSREDEQISRQRGLRGLVSQWVKLPSIDLWLVWTIVRTMGHWNNYAEYNEYTYPAMLDVFRSALARHERAIAIDIYAIARHIFLVEKAMPAQVAEWASLFIASGLPCPTEIAEDMAAYTPPATLTSAHTEGRKLALEEQADEATPTVEGELTLSEESFDPEALFQLSQSDFSRFEHEISVHRVQVSERAQARDVRRLMGQLDGLIRGRSERPITSDDGDDTEIDDNGGADDDLAFSQFLSRIHAGYSPDSLTPEVAMQLHEIADRHVVDRAAAIAVADLVIAQRATASGREDLPALARKWLDLERWADQLVSTAMHRYAFEERLLAPHLPRWIQQSRREVLPDWERLCKTRLDGGARRAGLLAVARRWQRLNPGRCTDLLRDAWASDSRFFFLSNDANAVLDLAFEIDPPLGRKLLMEAFQVPFQRYPGSTIQYVEHLLKYVGHYEHDADRVYDLLAQYGEHLIEGLAPHLADTDWLIDWKSPPNFHTAVINYLFGLFNYPEVDVRRLAMQVLHHEAVRDPVTLAAVVVRFGDLEANAMEHVVTVLYAIALARPTLLASHINAIVGWLDVHHHAIYHGVRGLLHALEEGGLVLGDELGSRLRSDLNPLVILSSGPLTTSAHLPLPDTLSRFQSHVIDRAARVAPDGIFAQAVHARLSSAFHDEELAIQGDTEVHNKHYINSNFDRIEVEGPYEVALQEAVNRALLDFSNAPPDEPLSYLFALLRRYDPTDLLVARGGRPDYINWLPKVAQTDEAFLDFADHNDVKAQLLSRPHAWTTLYEHTEQRSYVTFSSESDRRVKTRLVAFAVPAGAALVPAALQAVLERPETTSANRYRFELCRAKGETDPALIPLVHIARRYFRGHPVLDAADIPRTVAERMGLASAAWPWPLRPSVGESMLRPTEWQEAFDQGRRLHKPVSEGFILEISGDLLRDWLQKEERELVYLVLQSRSVERYKSESEMVWVSRKWVIRAPSGE